jgi:Flp pilus assembly protein TadG
VVTAVMRNAAKARLRRLRFAADESGVSAVEFALILPIMLTLYFGAVELGDALTINRKVTHVTSSLSDLVTQSKTISDSDMDNILDAATAVMTPYAASDLTMKVTGVTIDANGVAKVAWSDARNTTALTKGASITVPAAVKLPNTFLVTAEVHYSYTPIFGYVMIGTFDLNDSFYLRPRLSDKVCRNTPTC